MYYKTIFKTTLLFTLCMMLLFTTVLAEDSAATISVTGNASISIVPDTAKLDIGVTSINKKVEAAQQESNTKMNNIVNALKEKGLEETDIKTSQFSVYPVYDYNSTDIKSYRVENIIQVNIKDISTIGEIIDLSVKNGANTAYNITYESSNSLDKYLEALALATDNAKKKATAIAKAHGKELGEVVSINESQGYGYHQAKTFRNNSLEDASATDIMISDVDVSAELYIVYAIK